MSRNLQKIRPQKTKRRHKGIFVSIEATKNIREQKGILGSIEILRKNNFEVLSR